MTQECCEDESDRLSVEYLPIEFDPRNFTGASPSLSSSSSSTSTSSSSSTSTSSRSASSSTKAPLPAAPSSPSPPSPPSPPSHSDLSPGSKAGLGIGISVAALAFLALGFLWNRRRKASPSNSFDHTSADRAPLEKTQYVHWGSSVDGASQSGQGHGHGSFDQSAVGVKQGDGMEIQVHGLPV